jgi:hypothetical protein
LAERAGGDPDDFAFGFFHLAEGEVENGGYNEEVENGDDDDIPPELRIVHVRVRRLYLRGQS